VVEETIRGETWWWFFTQPLVYSVYWKPDGSKTFEQYLHEQAALARAHALGNARRVG
jgi:hypothetical protein